MSFTEALPLPLSTPLSQQEELPLGLPAEWHSLGLQEQAGFLLRNSPLLRVPTYISAGLETGARCLDNLSGSEDKTNETTLQSLLNTKPVHADFLTGFSEHIHLGDLFYGPEVRSPDNPIHKQELLNCFKPGEVRGEQAQQAQTVAAIETHFGNEELLNPTFLRDIFGLRRKTGYSGVTNPRERLYDSETYTAILKAEWSVCLRALAGVQHLHQAAAKAARILVTPLLKAEPSQPMAGQESLFWNFRLTGRPTGVSIAYALGYRAKSGPALAEAMRQEWGAAYTRNRAIFTTALNIGTPKTDKEKQAVTMRIRQPVCNAIGEGDFDGALDRLQEGLAQHPGLFSIVSHKSLEKADTTSQA